MRSPHAHTNLIHPQIDLITSLVTMGVFITVHAGMGGQCGEEEGCLHGHGVLLLVGLSRSLVDIDCVRILLCVQVLYPILQVRTPY
jgi:hypothetical protein